MHHRSLLVCIVCCLMLASCGSETLPTDVPTTLAEATIAPNEPSTLPTTLAEATTIPATVAPIMETEEATSVSEIKVTEEPTSEPTSSAKLVFGSGLDGSVRAIDLATGNEFVLADPTEVNQLLPWSAAPNGQSIAVITGYGFRNPKGDGLEEAALWVVNVDETEPRKLLEIFNPNTLNPDNMTAAWLPQVLAGQFQNIIWTADGREIIVTSAHEGQVDLYAISVESGAARRLTNTPALEFDAALSPDGAWIAYGSTSNFGTGAGWGDVQVQTQAYLGGDVFTVIGDPAEFPPAAAYVLGWTSDNRVLATTSDNGSGTTILWRTEPSQAPELIIEDSYISASTMQGDQVAYAVRDLAQEQANNGVFTWNATSDDEPMEIIEDTAADFIAWSPDASALLICENVYAPQTPAKLWRDGNLIDVGSVNCQQHTWSQQHNLAVGNVVVRADQPTSLAPNITPAAWDADTFYYFEPTADARWQLYAQAADASTSTIGEPIDVDPYQTKLVR